jgi:hypothetical protein
VCARATQEVFNEPEGCHGLNSTEYVKQFDAVVNAIRRDAAPEVRMVPPWRAVLLHRYGGGGLQVAQNMKFVGLALEDSGNFQWVTDFLTTANHDSSNPATDVVSFHFYGSCSNRSDPATYEQFFSAADGFFHNVETIVGIRNQLSPHTLLDANEMGTILYVRFR